ncbi:kelch repeat and BTB domain-containing protein 8-like [Branchiostoma floridae]|uniref:Kelch repeat and BTB domain-containing protein 8-like n=1 Tax=Branchiostoma floridae TaxID=7739 RepID=A0A9J7LTQ4_BRAFL|nr:kelch repeat and BTB domain-containing protein 8-like [Branchiostoma floridae]
MNPREGKYISCSYKPKDLPRATDVTVTSDNNIYILTHERESDRQLSIDKYNHAGNVWEDAGMSSVSEWQTIENDSTCYDEQLVEVDGILFCIAADAEGDSGLVWMKKYNRHTDQWEECSLLQLDVVADVYREALSCGSYLYYLGSIEMHRYDPSQDRWCKLTPPIMEDEVSTAVAMGTEIFCTDFNFSQTILYDTESDQWQKLQGWPNPGNLYIDNVPRLFVLENQLHIVLICTSESQEEYIYMVYVHDRSADAWRDLTAYRSNKIYHGFGCRCVAARIYPPYLMEA